ncbi:hypothetical protein GPJ56_008182 [Histomonas meleagridis]|uniref:uncharacterized protein n=1 Tax=Histomonas meleagridis TaxID=135588 RepID=UPI00355A174C|nr:hypothetical protein GPJ56_008182 [Histomonas meleagridis]KAH0797203.1 hypothetical protein GO595_009885 [Histomonas meleagridis]
MQIRKGKKFSDVVNVKEIIKEHPSFKNLLDAIDEVQFPEYSCYSEVLVRLNIDCNNANEDQQKLLSVYFTQCYYNITGRLDEFPTSYPDEEKIQHMQSHVYGTYVTMKTHWSNLCHFAKQSIFNEETAKQLISLFKSVVDSSNAIKDMNDAMNESARSLNVSVHNITKKLESGKEFLTNIGTQILKFNVSLKAMTEIIMKPLEHIEQVKIFFLMAIISVFIGIFLPEILIPLLMLTAIFYFGDSAMRQRYDWYNGYVRTIMKILYLVISASYPLYKLAKNTVSISSYLLRLIHVKKKPTTVIPRIGRVQQRKYGSKPRAY